MMRLEIYRDSKQILEMVKQCVKQEDKAYLRTRLETSQNPYTRAVSKALFENTDEFEAIGELPQMKVFADSARE